MELSSLSPHQRTTTGKWISIHIIFRPEHYVMAFILVENFESRVRTHLQIRKANISHTFE